VNEKIIKGRAALSNQNSRYDLLQRQDFDDGWFNELPATQVKTEKLPDNSKSIISYNKSPDVPFDRSINPYRGCEHGCIYCFARPSHAWLGLSPGLDFETQLFYKSNAAQLLEKELAKKSYQCNTIALGVNTDTYQPLDRKLELTRSLLQVMQSYQHPVALVTKSSLVERDIDLLSMLANKNLVHVYITLTMLDAKLSIKMEPRAAAPKRRLQTIESLTKHGIPVSVMVAPIIPVLTDPELESLLAAAHSAGAKSASYVMLRLPREVKDLFVEWLDGHEPGKKDHILSQIAAMHEGQLYQSEFGQRMSGKGQFADMISQRFKLVCKRLGLRTTLPELNTQDFQIPKDSNPQLSLF